MAKQDDLLFQNLLPAMRTEYRGKILTKRNARSVTNIETNLPSRLLQRQQNDNNITSTYKRHEMKEEQVRKQAKHCTKSRMTKSNIARICMTI